jgi:hypothetical protein
MRIRFKVRIRVGARVRVTVRVRQRRKRLSSSLSDKELHNAKTISPSTYQNRLKKKEKREGKKRVANRRKKENGRKKKKRLDGRCLQKMSCSPRKNKRIAVQICGKQAVQM